MYEGAFSWCALGWAVPLAEPCAATLSLFEYEQVTCFVNHLCINKVKEMWVRGLLRSLSWSVSPPRWGSISWAPLNWLSLLKRRGPSTTRLQGIDTWKLDSTVEICGDLSCLCNFTLTFIFFWWGGIFKHTGLLWSFFSLNENLSRSFSIFATTSSLHSSCPHPPPHLRNPEHAPTLRELSGLLEAVNQGGIRWLQPLFMTD